MRLRVVDVDLHLTRLSTRMPFRYGIATLTEMPHAFVRVVVEAGGRAWTGVAADSLPPKWFTKDPEESFPQEIEAMLAVIQHAMEAALDEEASSVFDLWLEVEEVQGTWARNEGFAPLLAQFGVSLVERAVIEAACRAAGRPFHEMLRADALGVRLGNIHAELGGLRPSRFIQAPPLPSVLARHTVGLVDPLADDDIPAQERLGDGLPQSLEASIRAYGLRHFKIKLAGKAAEDRERLHALAVIIGAGTHGEFALTLDGNEHFRSVAAFRDYWAELRSDRALEPFLGRTMFVEQPLHRSCAMDAGVAGAFEAWRERPLMIIDESDEAPGSLETALRLGYSGTSHKNCKGVFKSIANACLIASRQATQPHRRLVISGEDLCNVGPIALQQDLAVAAALGISSVERNGHHYNAGLSQFPAQVRELVLEAHPDLFHRAQPGWPSATIEDGRMALGSTNQSPFGVGFELSVENFAPASAWRW